MRRKPSLLLRKIGPKFMIVDTCAENALLTNVYTLNASAAFVWEAVADSDFTPESVAALLQAEYGIDEATALADSHALLEEWKEFGLVI